MHQIDPTPDTLKLGIVFISHDTSVRKTRSEELKKQLTEIISKLEHVKISSWKLILWQPRQYTIKHKKYFQLLDFRIRASREWGNKSWLGAIKQTIVFEFRTTLKGRSQLLISQENLFVAVILTEKHARAWTNALDDSLDALLVLEDDAILEEFADSILSQAFSFMRSAEPILVNLSKGNDFTGYPREYLQGELKKNWFKLKAADTTCAYLVNRMGLKFLAENYSQRPDSSVMGSDFVISDAILRNNEFKVLHATSPPFINGSLFGLFESQTGSLPKNTSGEKI